MKVKERIREGNWILYLCCTDPVLILYWAGCSWLDFQGVFKILFKVPFPHSVRLLRKFLPPQCSRGWRMRSLQIINKQWKDPNPHTGAGGFSCLLLPYPG
jgi:hypothetical protein